MSKNAKVLKRYSKTAFEPSKKNPRLPINPSDKRDSSNVQRTFTAIHTPEFTRRRLAASQKAMNRKKAYRSDKVQVGPFVVFRLDEYNWVVDGKRERSHCSRFEGMLRVLLSRLAGERTEDALSERKSVENVLNVFEDCVDSAKRSFALVTSK